MKSAHYMAVAMFSYAIRNLAHWEEGVSREPEAGKWIIQKAIQSDQCNHSHSYIIQGD